MTLKTKIVLGIVVLLVLWTGLALANYFTL
jgi:hypothetical protein